jgi:hypothetical protein
MDQNMHNYRFSEDGFINLNDREVARKANLFFERKLKVIFLHALNSPCGHP